MKDFNVIAIVVALINIVNIFRGMSYGDVLQLDLKILIFLTPFAIIHEAYLAIKMLMAGMFHAKKKNKKLVDTKINVYSM